MGFQKVKTKEKKKKERKELKPEWSRLQEEYQVTGMASEEVTLIFAELGMISPYTSEYFNWLPRQCD